MDTNTTNKRATTNGDNLVTIAIHTFEKAQILQTILQSQGVEAVLQNVNQLVPIVSSGVRVRIKESDLPRALYIIEEVEWDKEDLDKNTQERKDRNSKEVEAFVLLPIDFSDFTPNIIDVGFTFAERRNLKVTLIHSVYSPYFGGLPLDAGDMGFIPLRQQQIAGRELAKGAEQMEELKKEIEQKQSEGKLPTLPFDAIVREGAPDEVILHYSSRHKPVAIIMGTRGRSKNEGDLIGSVAAEVIDSAKVPVLVVPENIRIHDLAELHNVGVATSFDQRDLMLFDRMMQIMAPNRPFYHMFNISRSKGAMGELQLRIMRDYHQKHYPEASIEFMELDKGDFSEALDEFVKEKEIELIVVNTYRRNLLAKFFNPSMARRMLFHAGTPLLVMHSNSSK